MTRIKGLVLGVLLNGCSTIPQLARTVHLPNGQQIAIPQRLLLPPCYQFTCRAHPYHLDTQCQCDNGGIFRLRVDYLPVEDR